MMRLMSGIRSRLGQIVAGPAEHSERQPERQPDTPASATGPLLAVSSAQARTAHRDNPYTTWAARARPANDADTDLACHRIWQPLPQLRIVPRFSVARSDSLLAIGSCFAREVEDALHALGIDVPSRCDALFESPPLQHDATKFAGVRPRSYLNRYNTMSMLQEFRHLAGLAPELERGLLAYELAKGATADLHYSQSLSQADFATTLARRQRVRGHFAPLLRRCKLFVITLGMAECWFDQEAGRYLNNTPGPRVLEAYGDRLAVHLTRFEQHRAALESLHELLAGIHGADFRIVITVSPVPLERSFLAQDVVATNCYSKSMLRAAAQEFAAMHANVDYFPSFELVSYANPAGSWAWDYRHVTPELVEHIMTLFVRHYIDDTAPPQTGA